MSYFVYITRHHLVDDTTTEVNVGSTTGLESAQDMALKFFARSMEPDKSKPKPDQWIATGLRIELK